MESMDDYLKELDESFRVIKLGDVLTGMIVDISEEQVTLDINYFAPGVIPIYEISDDPDFKPMATLKLGEEITANVISLDDGNGNVVLSRKNAARQEAWDKLEKLYSDQTTIEVKIKEAVNAGVICYVEGVKAFIPASQLAAEYVEDTSSYVDQKILTKVITADRDNEKLVLSAKQIIVEKKLSEKQNKLKGIIPGSDMEGIVDSLQPYGAFITLENGLSGLCHISKICAKRISKPSEVLKLGQKVKVKIIDVKDGKISLSMLDFDEAMSFEDDDEPAFEYHAEEEKGMTAFEMIFKNIKLE